MEGETKMSTFIAIYRGDTIADARIVAVSANQALIAEISSRLLREPIDDGEDPVVRTLEQSRRKALRLIKREAATSCV
jgi:hypothetical protein